MTKEEVEHALPLLIERSYCRFLPEETNPGPGRKPSRLLEINPELYEK